MIQLGAPIITVFRLAATMTLCLLVVVRAGAHHGGGTFDNSKTIELTGKLTDFDATCKARTFAAYSKAGANTRQ
jgi:hypothetical protein